jgi:hypothetical protein
MDLKHYLNSTPINLDIAHVPNKSWGSFNSIALYKKYISTLNFEFNSFFFLYNKDFFPVKEILFNSNNFFFPVKIYFYLSHITLPYSLLQNFYFFFKAIGFS